MQGAVLDVMNRGLQALEPHGLLGAEPSPWSLARFEMHTLAFADELGRLLAKRVARNVDRDHPQLLSVARAHLRLHQPLARGLRTHLINLGRSRPELETLNIGSRTRAVLRRGEHALEQRDPILTHVIFLQGLECLTQLLARRGVELAGILGGQVAPFESRHRGHEGLLFLGLEVLDDRHDYVIPELQGLFGDALGLLDEWYHDAPPHRPAERRRRRGERWGTGDLPNDVA